METNAGYLQRLEKLQLQVKHLQQSGVPKNLTDEEAIDALRYALKASRQIETILTRLLIHVEDTNVAHGLGVDTSDVVSHTVGNSKKESNGIVLGALQQAPYPEITKAYAEGELGKGALNQAVKTLDALAKDLNEEQYEEAKGKVLHAATHLVDLGLRRELDRICGKYPDARSRLERESEEIRKYRYLMFTPIRGGWRVSGKMPHETGLTIRSALGNLSRAERARQINNDEETTTEPARMIDALERLCRPHATPRTKNSAEPGKTERRTGGDRKLKTQQSEQSTTQPVIPGTTPGAAPDSRGQRGEEALRSLDSGTSRRETGRKTHAGCEGGVVKPHNNGVGNPQNSQPHQAKNKNHKKRTQVGQSNFALETNASEYDLGRSRRTATPMLRQAVLARDGGCIAPKCDAISDTCEIHHVIEWRKGGATDLNNLVALCPAHHRAAGRTPAGLLVINPVQHNQPAVGIFNRLDQLAAKEKRKPEAGNPPTLKKEESESDKYENTRAQRNGGAVTQVNRNEENKPAETAGKTQGPHSRVNRKTNQAGTEPRAAGVNWEKKPKEPAKPGEDKPP
ncbi:MAG: HNH endonuclease signature motif containing protein [Actinomycetaceae bacterium]|nr:HNH endonuclease signature motif containing protein [Actinomycetaceae bacterium]